MRDLDEQALELAWGNRQEPYFGTATVPDDRHVGTRDAALKRIRDGDLFWGTLPRTAQGNSKTHVTPAADLLWVDRDIYEGLDHVLQILRDLALEPTWITFSGRRGWHFFSKLTRDIPVSEIERYNKILISLLDGDKGTWDRTRIIRAAGNVHPKSGKRCEVIELGGQLHDPERLKALDALVPDPVTKRPYAFRRLVDKPRGEVRSDGVWLPPRCINYLRDGDLGPFASPSEAEQALFFHFVIAGLSDDECIRRAYGQFPSVRRRLKQSYGLTDDWIRKSLSEARRFALEDYHLHIDTSPEGGTPRRVKRLIDLAALLDQCKSLANGKSVPRDDLVYDVSGMVTSPGKAAYTARRDAKRKLDRAIRDGLLEELPDGSLRRSDAFSSLSPPSTHSSTPPLYPGAISGPEPIHVPVESSNTRPGYEVSVSSVNGSTQDSTEQELGNDWAAVEPRKGHSDRHVYDDSALHGKDERNANHASRPIAEKDLARDSEGIVNSPDGRDVKHRPGGLYDRLQVRHPDKLPPRTYHDDGTWTSSDESCVEKPAYEPTGQEREEHKRACDEIDHLLASSGRPRKDEGGL